MLNKVIYKRWIHEVLLYTHMRFGFEFSIDIGFAL